ncbi:MAG: hypothetical protein P8X98_03585 [Woeseiaceae bacterium]|jgi:hypothetical protein
MSSRLKTPKAYSIAAVPAALVMVGLATVPVLAAPGPALQCDDSKPVVSRPTTSELAASPVSSGDDNLQHHLLQPDAKSAARGAFADESSNDVIDETELETETEDASSDNGLQSGADRKVLPLKRQMYRRDI